MQYGERPTVLNPLVTVECDEMMFYQYLPIKMIGETEPVMEKRLNPFTAIIGMICCDYVGTFGLDSYTNSYIYVSAKKLYQAKDKPYNRPGWHSDGFLTTDINYIWSDDGSTVFNDSKFNITLDDRVSLKEFEEQALPENDFTLPPNAIVRLNQYNIHRVGDVTQDGLRTFVKVSFSKDRYNLKGNSHNHLLDYSWDMLDRSLERNIPQK